MTPKDLEPDIKAQKEADKKRKPMTIDYKKEQDVFVEQFSKLGYNIVELKDEYYIKSGVTSNEIKSFLLSSNHRIAEQVVEQVREWAEKSKRKHFVFECNGAYGGKGCYETFCEDFNGECKSEDAKAVRNYNQALSDLLSFLTSLQK